MTNDINSAFDRLERELAQFQRVRRLRDDREPYITRALSWLISHQHKDGYWGDGSALDTLTSLQAIAAWDINTENWPTTASVHCGIDQAFDWLGVTGHNLCPRSGQFFSH